MDIKYFLHTLDSPILVGCQTAKQIGGHSTLIYPKFKQTKWNKTWDSKREKRTL